jgi:hypothetical protein
MDKNDFWTATITTNFCCATCMFYANFRCKRHAPTMGGFPAVMPTDVCGDHRMGKETMKEITNATNQVKK